METAEERKIHAKIGSDAAAKKRSEKAKPFIDGVVAAYGYLRFGKPKIAGEAFLLVNEWVPEFNFKIGFEHAEAINLLAAITGKTKTRIRQIIRERWPNQESHLVKAPEKQVEKWGQPSLLDFDIEP